MKILLLFLLAASVARCQTLPNIFLVGGEANASTTPKPAGFAAIALPINSAQKIYSFTMYQAVGVAGKIPTTQTTTGAATGLRSFTFGSISAEVIGIGSIGASTGSGATTSAFNGGGGVLVHGLFKKWPDALLWLGALQNKAGSLNQTQVMIGLGRTF